MSSRLNVQTVSNVANTSSIVLDNIDLTGRYIRRIYTQVDTASRSATTTWVAGPSFEEVEGFLPGSVIRLDYFIPGRNDSATWGGMYPEIQYKIDDRPWESLGGPGYDVVMVYGAGFINSYSNTIFLTPNQETPFSLQFRFYFRSYDGTVYWNLNHDINANSGTATIMSGNNGNQHFSHIIVQELALLNH